MALELVKVIFPLSDYCGELFIHSFVRSECGFADYGLLVAGSSIVFALEVGGRVDRGLIEIDLYT